MGYHIVKEEEKKDEANPFPVSLYAIRATPGAAQAFDDPNEIVELAQAGAAGNLGDLSEIPDPDGLAPADPDAMMKSVAGPCGRFVAYYNCNPNQQILIAYTRGTCEKHKHEWIAHAMLLSESDETLASLKGGAS